MTERVESLHGMTVLDFTQGVAGPHATQLMAMQGAEVIKIEPPGGEWGRTLGRQYGAFTAHFIAFNRGKKCISVDLKDEEVAALIRDRARRADVIAESFRPGVMARFGLDYESVARENPGIVYLSVSGFGQRGPYRDRPVTDAVIQAFSGWMSMNRSRAGVPQRSGMVAMDVMTGLYGFQAVMAALMQRLRFGGGRWIDCSLMNSAIAFQAAKVAEHRLQGGKLGNLYAPVGAFETAEGVINITAMRDSHFRALCRVLGLADLREDARFATGDARLANEAALEALLTQAFRTRPARDWAPLLTEAGVMNAVVQDYDDLFADPQVEAAEIFDWITQPGLGAVPVPRVPGMDPVTEPGLPVGADTRGVLRGFGLGGDAIAGMEARGAAVAPTVQEAAGA